MVWGPPVKKGAELRCNRREVLQNTMSTDGIDREKLDFLGEV